MMECDLLETCGFFKKYQGTLDMACRGFIKTFCTGERMNECKRKAYRLEHGQPPIDHMLPSGQIMPKEQQI